MKNFKNIFAIPELTRKLLFTLGVLVIYRLGAYVPAIGVNVPLLAEKMLEASARGGLWRYLDIFSGGALFRSALFSLGIMPYITASIMMQMLSMGVPYFEQLVKEGEYGRRIINQYTRYLTIFLSIAYSFTYALFLESSNLALAPGWGFRLLFVLSLTTGTVFVMWLADQISLFGIGNGSSILIFAGIVAQFPGHVFRTIAALQAGMPIWHALIILILFLFIAVCIIFVEKAERKIPIQYARRVIGQRVYAAQSTYIPFKINTAGVMPVIFAGAVLNLPMFITSFLVSWTGWEIVKEFAKLIQQGAILYNILEFLLIVFFSFVYTAVIFNPEELAENLKKSGGFVPGVRPGKRTAEFFNYILTRIGLIGSIYLACLALAPNIMHSFIMMPFFIGGTSLLIVISVALETSAQIESYLLEHRYEGFLSSGRIKG